MAAAVTASARVTSAAARMAALLGEEVGLGRDEVARLYEDGVVA